MGGSVIYGISNDVLIFFAAFVTFTVGVVTFCRWYFSFELTQQNIENMQATGQAYNSEICPICLGPHRLAVETNCGHKFCGQCLRNFLTSRAGPGTLFQNPTCPMCRQNINLLLLSFARDEEAQVAERREVENSVYEYNVRFGNGPRSVLTYIRDCPVLLRHMFSNFFSFGGLVLLFRVRVMFCFIAAVFYLLLPLDIIPETLFGFFGLLDDFLVLFLCAIYLSFLYRHFLLSQANDADALE